mgnify:CR=1 FL=1
MDGIERIMEMLDYSLNTRKKRHIIGGVLISMSLLFGGLAITVMTLKTEDKEDE